MSIRPTTIVAHRGLHHQHLENTLPAFQAAVVAGVPWVECDVWPSRDGVPMVIHDETLDRTTSATGPVNQKTAAQLQDLGVPTLAELLKILPEKTGILVEIKPPDSRPFVADVVSQLKARIGPWMYQSFDLINVAFPRGPVAFLIDDPNLLGGALETDLNLHVDFTLIDQAMVQTQHARGKTIGVWTVNDPADIRRMLDFGVDMLITDEPELAMQLMRA